MPGKRSKRDGQSAGAGSPADVDVPSSPPVLPLPGAPGTRAPEPSRRSEADPRRVVVWAVDAQGRFTLWDGNGCEALGHAAGSVVGRSVTEVFPDLVPGGDVAATVAALAAAPSAVHVLRRGDCVWEALVVPVRDGRGVLQNVLGVSHDVTARTRAEQEVRQREARLRDVAEHIREVLWFIRPDSPETFYVSPAYEKLWGMPVAELAERPTAYLDAVHVDDLERVRAGLAQMSEERPLDVTYRIVRPDGSLRWIRDRGFPITDEHGVTVRVAGIAEDITALVEAQQGLQESERRFRQLAEALSEALSIRDLETGRIIYLSPAFESMWGLPVEDVYRDARCTLARVHPDDRAVLAEVIERPRWDLQLEYRIVRPDGAVRWIHARTFPIRDEGGRVCRIAGLMQDITGRKEVEEELRRHHEQLDALVRERAVRIQDMERQHAEDERWVASGRMSAHIAHEINGPLAGVTQAFLLLREAVPADHPHAWCVGLIDKELERIASVVRQLFDLHRPAVPVVGSCDVADVIGAAVRLVQPAASSRGITVRVVTPGGERLRAGLPDDALRDVLFNLLHNAVEASSPGATVDVMAERRGDVRIVVRDRGHGIPADVRPHVFEPFFTTKSRRERSGLGLGLSLARTIVESVGGKILLRSTAGRGTTCQIVMPPLPDGAPAP